MNYTRGKLMWHLMENMGKLMWHLMENMDGRTADANVI